ncbi:hypothetical protein [Flavilitoribacter nigricans]|uniref:Uncharacterized protein n=1 Tax=Flavilitoribacter nigricans (strain ATCC 23147 / DSM 23189 / NBRC 102662 / NCIMB 1420 / SS-2) TaxID=1122177 RepID=A0A2D0NJ06_FLAN2|nr:hypothetical protein [Flavilitoribacter nigricans]PHN08485.1 hypothetical protein CRP01_00815 [Flavilitoribacter nigricans DSM 23189 = NBRC 102662]
MKSFFWTLSLCLIAITTVSGQYNEQLSLNYIKIKGTYATQHSVIEYQPNSQSAVVDMERIREGYNLIATDLRSGLEIFLVTRKLADQLVVAGFAARSKGHDKWVIIQSPPQTYNGKSLDLKSISCPVGFDIQWVCNSNDTGTLQICYYFCTANRLVIKLP